MDKFCIDFFIEGAKPDLKNHLTMYDFKKFRECEKRAIKYEDRRIEERRGYKSRDSLAALDVGQQGPDIARPKVQFRSPPYRRSFPSQSQSQMTCHFCHEKGHSYRTCPKASNKDRDRIMNTPLDIRRNWSANQAQNTNQPFNQQLNSNATSSNPPRASQ